MKVAAIIGTELKGCTYRIAEQFLEPLRRNHEVTTFTLPRDLPAFCTGCKVCFDVDESKCPHADYVAPIWQAFSEADLIAFVYPVYAMRAPAQVKALIDHLCVHWLVHRPKPFMFSKRAVILTQSIGAPNGAAQKDVVTCLNWLGVSAVHRKSFKLIEGVKWDELSEKKRRSIGKKIEKFAATFQTIRPGRMSLKVRLLFFVSRIMQLRVRKSGLDTADLRHWTKQGWI